MIGEELTAIIWRLTSFQDRIVSLEQKRELDLIIENVKVLRGKAFGKVLVDPAKMEIERREAGVR